MKFVLLFLGKLIFTVFYLIRITLSLLWHLNINEVDFRIKDTPGLINDGNYYKNIFAYWQNKTDYSEELGKEQQQNREQWY